MENYKPLAEVTQNSLIAFTAVMNLPHGQIVNRSTLLKEVDTDTAGFPE